MDPPHPHCICAHLHFPTQICLVPPHGFTPLHDCHTFPSHSHGHMPTRTDTWMPTRMDTWMPTSTDTCPLALITFITFTPTCMSPHRYVSSPCMDAHPLMLVSPTTHLNAPPWVPPHQPCAPLCSSHPCLPTCPCTDMSHLPTRRPAPSSLLHFPSTHLAQMPLISPARIPPS